MKSNVKAKQTKKFEQKKVIEQISNKMLVIFTVALISEVVLMFLYSAFKSTSAVRIYLNYILTYFTLGTLLAFIGLFITGVMFAKKGKSETAVSKFKNWSYLSLGCSIGAFVIMPNSIVEVLFGANLASKITNVIGKFTGTKAVIAVMIAVVVYVIAAFIYYNIKIKKIKKS